ncbi:MAG: hypothetical protein K2O18_14395 [Oscillospiraceae bacterium]|nr:hypothetical protein [Oscillospiraceae bacterium]
MKMGLQGDTLIIAEMDSVQFTVIKSWGKMKWDKKKQRLTGIADLELMDKLSTIVKLPPKVEARRQQLQAVADAVDRERMNEKPVPFVNYPVKLPLYAHQVRGANMALLTFGWIGPDAASSE